MSGGPTEHELTEVSTLLNPDGTVTQVDWARQALQRSTMPAGREETRRQWNRWAG